MSEPEGPAEGSLSVDFDQITRLFRDLKPIIYKVTDVQEFGRAVQLVTSGIFVRYLTFPQSRYYKVEDTMLLIPHVINCINTIIPQQIPYEAFSMKGSRWALRPKRKDNEPMN